MHGPAVGLEIGDEVVDDRLGSAYGGGPAARMGDGREHRGRGRGAHGRQPADRVRGDTGEQGLGGFVGERNVPGRTGLAQQSETEFHDVRDAGNVAQGLGNGTFVTEGEPDRVIDTLEERGEESPPFGSRLAEAVDRLVEIVEGQRGGLPIEGLGVGDLGGGESEAASAQIEVDEEGTGDGQWVDGRADVVSDAWGQSEVEGAGTAADRRLSLEHFDAQPGTGQGYRGGHAVGTTSDDDCINTCAHVASLGQ